MAANRLAIAVLATLLVATASASSLISYSTCSRLLSFYHENAIERASIFVRMPPRRVSGPPPRPLRSPPRGRGGRGGPLVARRAPQPLTEVAAFEAPTAELRPESNTRSREAGVDFSDTNVQVSGVDEPDIIKTDGKRVFVVRGRRLSLVRTAATGSRGEVVSTLELPSNLREMLIEKDTLLLIGTEYGSISPADELEGLIAEPKPQPRPRPVLQPMPRPRPVLQPRPRPRPRTGVPRSGPRPGPTRLRPDALTALQRRVIRKSYGQSLTVVYKVSAAGGKLRLVETLRMEGSYISAREVNGVVRIVTTYRPRYNFYHPVSIARGARAPSAAAATIRRTTIGTWLPRYSVTTGSCGQGERWCGPQRTGSLVSCGRVYHPDTEFSGFGLLTVTTVRMTSSLYPRSTSVVSDGRNVYATASSLYVATAKYRNDFQGGARDGASFSTSFHKFRLRSLDAVYEGSGSVTGSVLNQFSMHEHRGVFYVATTVGAPWWRGRDQSRSKVTSFRQVGNALRSVGSVGDLGVGERIYAVRYVGALAYVVTFRQVDPLYVLDIKNPARMRVTGELKIPGFSSYLHPIGNGRLLGVGRDATPEGRTTGAKVSLFDVSDVNRPKELAAWTLKGSYSSARWDHRAFLYWAPESVAVLPLNVNSGNRSERFSGSILLKVSGNRITEKGRISHPKCCGQYASQPSIERNFVLGRTNLWSLSRELLQVNDIRTLAVKSNVEL